MDEDPHRIPITNELDLHTFRPSEIGDLLPEYFNECHQAGIRGVRVIHGKGLHGDSTAPVLKNLVDRLLRHRADVLAFASAPPNQGGTGAVLVLLAAKR